MAGFPKLSRTDIFCLNCRTDTQKIYDWKLSEFHITRPSIWTIQIIVAYRTENCSPERLCWTSQCNLLLPLSTFDRNRTGILLNHVKLKHLILPWPVNKIKRKLSPVDKYKSIRVAKERA